MAGRSGLLLLPATASLFAAAQGPAPRLDYDPAVYLAGDCLSPGLAGCNAAGRSNPSASQALLGVDREPLLLLELGGLLDLGPQVTGGRGPDETALR
jgi:hypothetical protein